MINVTEWKGVDVHLVGNKRNVTLYAYADRQR